MCEFSSHAAGFNNLALRNAPGAVAHSAKTPELGAGSVRWRVCSKHRGDLGNSPIFARFSRPPESLCELGIAIFISDDSASIRGNLENWGDMFFIFARSPESLCEFGIVI